MPFSGRSGDEVGALYGLTTRLLLRHDAAQGGTASRVTPEDLLVVVHGRLDASRLRIARVPTASPATFAYRLDRVHQELAPLSVSEPLPLLYAVLLQAATTRPWTRDALTCETGVESAVRTLHSARCWSNAPRTSAELAVLAQIRGLAPARAWYPEHMRVMEMVSWSPVAAMPELDVLALRVDELIQESARVVTSWPA